MEKGFLALLLSLVLHLLFVEGLNLVPVQSPEDKDVVQIEIREVPHRASQKETKQIVRESLVPENMKVKENEDSLRFWSNETQRVRKQMRASEIGRTENRANQASQNKGSQQKQERERSRSSLMDRDELIAAAEAAASGAGYPTRQQNRGVSTIGESLPEDVEIGSFTSLNTDRYLYYSFFARVEDLIRYRWETLVQSAFDSTPKERLAANVRSRWTTQMEILLNSKGEFQKAVVMKQSGLPAFDQAAAQAFAQARLFPNPPAEMVEEDGMIHLKYSFTVHYHPSLYANP